MMIKKSPFFLYTQWYFYDCIINNDYVRKKKLSFSYDLIFSQSVTSKTLDTVTYESIAMNSQYQFICCGSPIYQADLSKWWIGGECLEVTKLREQLVVIIS